MPEGSDITVQTVDSLVKVQSSTNISKKKMIRYKNATLANVSRVNPKFDAERKRFNSLRAENKKFAQDEHEKWLSDSDYKGMDYYQFKDARSDRFVTSQLGRDYYDSLKKLNSMVNDVAKEHPLYDKSYRELHDFNFNIYAKARNIPVSDVYDDFRTVNFGEEVVRRIMMDIMYDE